MIDLVEIDSLSQVLCQEIIDLVLHILHNPQSISDHMYNEGNTHENKAPHCKETINMVCTATPSEDSDQLKSPPNGTRAFADVLSPWVFNESKTMVLITLKGGCPTDLSHRYAQMAHCLFCYGASFSFHVITLLKS